MSQELFLALKIVKRLGYNAVKTSDISKAIGQL